MFFFFFFFSSRRRHTRWNCDWSSDVCSSDLVDEVDHHLGAAPAIERTGGRERARMIIEEADLDGLGLGVGEVARRKPAAGAGDHERYEDDAEDLHTRASFGCGHASGRSEAVPKKVPNPSTRGRRESTGATAGRDHPLETAPALGRDPRRSPFDDVEEGRQGYLDSCA